MLIIIVSALLLMDSLYCLKSALQNVNYINQEYLTESYIFRPFHLFFLAFFGFATAIGAFKMKRWSVFLLLLLILVNQSVLFALGIPSILELLVSLIPLFILGYYFKRMT